MAEGPALHRSRRSVGRYTRAAYDSDQIVGVRGVVEPSEGDAVGGPPRHSSAGTVIPLTPRLGRIGRFEQMARDSQLLSPMRSRILGGLLRAANVSLCGGSAILRPLWANEAMHRAHQMVRLTRLLDSRAPRGGADSPESDLEWRIAQSLAATLLSLRIIRDTEKLPCSGALRDVVRDLVELFADAAGIDGIVTSIERLELASFKRRALVLMAGHLVIDTLFATRDRRGGQVVVVLDRPTPGIGRLAVSRNHQVVRFGPLDGSLGVTEDLASLLESEIMHRADGERIVSVVEFPVR
jgi:hypothetical protein